MTEATVEQTVQVATSALQKGDFASVTAILDPVWQAGGGQRRLVLALRSSPLETSMTIQ